MKGGNTYDKFINLNLHSVTGILEILSIAQLILSLFMVDDGWSHLSGYINFQNTFNWGT